MEEDHRLIFNHERLELDLRKLKTMDLKDPPRYNLPKARSQKEESIFMTKQTL